MCLRECEGDVECADGRACVEGACVPRLPSDPVLDFDASAADPATASLTPEEIDALLAMSPAVDSSTPVETPRLRPQIAGAAPGMELESTLEVAWDFPAGVPYRVLDGRFEGGELRFSWSLFDLWHGWCSLQTSYRWMIDDHAFSFCVPQDRTLWSSIDEVKVALCTSADFAPLCSAPDGALIPCPCIDTGPDCSFAYCRCDDAGCDADVHLGLMQAELTVEGDTMVGHYGGGGTDGWAGRLRKRTP